MALTGELSDLSLAELIEFFCNQRKTGRLKVVYPIGPGYFYLQSGSVVHARIGVLRGIEAVFYALTLANASFTFSPAFEPPEHTINQPWTSVVLEGLRRMDEGVKAGDAFPDGHHEVADEARAEEARVEDIKVEQPKPVEPEVIAPVVVAEVEKPAVPVVSPKFEKPVFQAPVPDMPDMGAFISQTDGASRFGSWKLLSVIAAVALIIGVVAIPWGWYARSKAAKLANAAQVVPAQNSQPEAPAVTTNETPAEPEASQEASQTVVHSTEAADLAAKHLREARAKERAAKTSQDNATGPTTVQSAPTAAPSNVAKTQSSPSAGSKKATVQVTFDENGRVTQASGGDATALRIARQKRFPAGKAGSATITIPIN
jgi:hypothetical protein